MATDIKNDATLSTNLVSVYEFKDGALGTDSHGSNDLTEVNTPTFSSIIQGGGVDLDRASSEYLTINDNASLSITGDISFSFWLNVGTDPGAGEIYNIFNKGNTGAASARSYGSILYESGGSSILRFFYWDSDGTSRAEGTDVVLASGGLYHVVMRADVSTPTCDIYINGSSSATISTSNATSINDTTDPFRIGTSESASNFYDGQIGQFCIWNKHISTSEISDLYNSGSGIPYESTGTPFVPKVTIF